MSRRLRPDRVGEEKTRGWEQQTEGRADALPSFMKRPVFDVTLSQEVIPATQTDRLHNCAMRVIPPRYLFLRLVRPFFLRCFITVLAATSLALFP